MLVPGRINQERMRGSQMASANYVNPSVKIGQEFHRWTVISRAEPDTKGRKHWNCQCKCGNTGRISEYNLYDGQSKSCGCLKREKTAQRSKKHGMTGTVEYRIWSGIKGRCCNPKNQAFSDYGGRGITMYEEWINSFDVFFAYVGLRPDPQYTIDRIDNDSGYRSGNIRWATMKEQARNRRSSRLITYNDETLTLAEWSERTGVNPSIVLWRIKAGCTPDEWFLPSRPGKKYER